MVWLAALEPAEQMEVNLPPPRRSLVPEATGPSKLHHVIKNKPLWRMNGRQRARRVPHDKRSHMSSDPPQRLWGRLHVT